MEPSLTRARALAFTSVGHFINDGSVFFVPLIVDLLVSIKGTTPLEVSFLLFLFYFGSSVSSVFVGRRADKSGAAGELMALGMGCLGIGLIGFYALFLYSAGLYTFPLAVVCVAVMGFGSSFYHPLGGSILQASFGQRTEGRALGINGAVGSLGRALYPSLFFTVASVSTPPDSIGFFGLISISAALLVWKGLRGVAIGRMDSAAGRTPFRAIMTTPMIILLVVSFLRSVSLFGIISYVPIFLTTQRGLGVSSLLGLSLTAMYASAIVGQPFFGLLTDKLDRRFVLAISAAGASASIVGYVQTEGIVSVGLLSLFGFFAYTGFPLLLSLASDYGPRNASSFGNSLIWGLGTTAGDSVGPLAVYAIALSQYSRLGIAFETMAGLAAVSAVASLLMPKSGAKRLRTIE